MDVHAIPVIELWGRLVVPLQGDVSDSQMDQLRDEVLRRVRDRAAKGLVIDASGMWLVDSHLCAMLGRIVASARLMGTRAVLSGLHPNVVVTLGEMGISLDGVETALSLEDALETLGIEVADDRDERDDERAGGSGRASSPSGARPDDDDLDDWIRRKIR